MKKISFVVLMMINLFLVACSSQVLKEGGQQFQQGDYAQSMATVMPLAEKGNAKAQYAVGYMYYYGQGVAMDKEQGEQWINKAAAQNYAPAQKAQAVMKKQRELNPLS